MTAAFMTQRIRRVQVHRAMAARKAKVKDSDYYLSIEARLNTAKSPLCRPGNETYERGPRFVCASAAFRKENYELAVGFLPNPRTADETQANSKNSLFCASNHLCQRKQTPTRAPFGRIKHVHALYIVFVTAKFLSVTKNGLYTAVTWGVLIKTFADES